MHAHCANCETSSLPSKTWVAGITGGILFVISMFDIMPGLQTSSGYILNWICALITLVVIGYSGQDFYIKAFQALRAGSANMDTLIALSTGIAWLYSVGVLIFLPHIPSIGQHVYFESSVVIIAFVNLGTLLELRAKRTTSMAIEALLNLQPKMARIIRQNLELDVNVAELKINDLVRVRPGEQIPVDGIITDGTAILNESMFTGEALPQNKNVGEVVIGGTISLNSSFVFKVCKIGADTTLAQIIHLVQQAQLSKPQLARLADKIAHIFVPIVIIIAIITAMVWLNVNSEHKYAYALLNSMAVLIIACPCALGLAVPMSLMVGVGKAAQYGILIKQTDAIQKIELVTYALLDKTGTITQGKPVLVNIYPAAEYQTDTILTIAASLEASSEHPLSKAIISAAQTKALALQKANSIEIFPGLGISGNIATHKISIGNAAFMAAQLINIISMRAQTDKCTQEGQTVVYVAQDKQLIGLMAIADLLKIDSASAIQDLRKLINNIAIITGDQLASAKVIAQKAGIDEVFANVMPQEKAYKVTELQNNGEKVIMIGDGINDAVALSQADISVAMGNGADIAKQSADIILLHNSLNSLLDVFSISGQITHNMRQNLFGAFLYNIIAIPIAAGALYPVTGLLLNPMLAGAAMALSSVTVVANANRLQLLKPYRAKSNV